MDTQTLTMLGSYYADRASQAFAIYKICQHGSTGISFAYAGYINIYWQLGILILVGTLGATGFTIIDSANLKRRKAKQDALSSHDDSVKQHGETNKNT